LEYAVFDDYEELQFIKSKLPNSIMSGSGSTYFILEDIKDVVFPETYQVFKDLKFIENGCTTV
jgi:4-diphosphocytidyl-2C-methyl-D-erythritol kinase